MNKPLITIITVCYNAVDTIEETILSVINQTYKNVEYVIIDGASTDGTIDIIKEYETKIDYWVSEPDNGIYDAMNKAINVSHGDWLWFINSGDKFIHDQIITEILPKLLRKNTIYYGNVLMIPENVVYDGKFNKTKICSHNICHQSILYPKTVFLRYKYNLKYKIYADWNLNLSCFADKDFKFEYIDLILSVYPTNGLSSVTPNDQNFINDFYGIILYRFGLTFFVYRVLLHYLSALARWGRKLTSL